MPDAHARPEWGIAAGLAAAHLCLALAYAWITPYSTAGFTQGQYLPDIGNPDEFAHAIYVRNLALGHGLPVLRPASPGEDPDPRSIYLGPASSEPERTHEAHQPPLYYVLAAAWSKALRVEEIMHPASGFKTRSLNALVGAGTVLGAYFLGLWATGRKEVAIGSAAIVALLPMMAALSGAVSNDPLAFLLCTWSLALIARWSPDWTPGRAAALGALIGLAILAKSSGLLLIPAALAALAAGGQRRYAVHASILLAIALGVALPWFLRNQSLYGDPLGITAFYANYERGVDPSAVFGGPRPFARWLYALASGTALSSVGLFGYMDIHLQYWIYLPVAAALVLGLAASRAGRGSSAPARAGLGPPFHSYFWLVVAAYVAFNLRYVQPQARYLFPAIGLLALWCASGLARKANWAPNALAAMLLLTNGYALGMLPGAFAERVEAGKIYERGSGIRSDASHEPDSAIRG